jgi:hypothetical protein
MTTIQSLTDLLDSWLGDIDPNEAKNLYPFGWRVGCVKMASPRHERFDMIRETGMSLLDKVFNNDDLPEGQLTFIFPERHMGVHEQQAFTHALSKHKDASKITEVDLITSSPLVISGFNRENIRILTWDDDEQYNGKLR